MPRRRWIRPSVVTALSVLLQTAPSADCATASRPAVNASTQEQLAFNRQIAAAKAAMLGDPARARQVGHAAHLAALAWPPGTRRDIAVATAQWIEGEGAYRTNDIAAAGPLTSEALSVAERAAPQSRLTADLLLSRGRLRREAGQPQAALGDLQRAYNMFALGHDEHGEARALQSIGSIYQDAQDYERVLYYYSQAEELATTKSLSLSAYNNIANAYFHLGRRREAGEAYAKALQLARKLQSPLLVASILDNVGDLDIENHDYAAAETAIAAGLKLTIKPAAAGWRPILLGTRAKLELAQDRLGEAQRDLAAAFAQVSAQGSDQSFSALQLTAYRVFKRVGDSARALDHLEAYRRMDDEGRTLAASTNAALMTARFDFANQNARIATLKAGQLSRDVALTRLRARQSAVMFSSVLALLAVVLVFLFVYLRSIQLGRNRVLAANDRLAKSNLELEDALQVKSQFLATTSHEIRTPLNGILGMTQVILAQQAIDPVVRDRIALVDAAGRAMRTLVDDILDFAKMDAGAVRLDTALVAVHSLLPELVMLWRVEAQNKGIDLQLSLAGVDAPLRTDPARLRQIVSNLLSNAIKFTSRGEVSVDARVEEGERRAIVIAVCDSGIGIPASAFETVFEPFRQLDTSTTRQFGGTGLGLAISRHLARVLGGDITVAAQPSGGACFTLCLPYPRVAAVEEHALPAAAVKVLVASSNPIRRSFLRTALADLGQTAVCDPGGVEAFAALDDIGIIVFDLGDGEAGMADDVLAAHRGKQTPIVLLVPVELAERRAGWEAAGAALVAVKPLRADALLILLHGLMREASAISTGSMADTMVFAVALP